MPTALITLSPGIARSGPITTGRCAQTFSRSGWLRPSLKRTASLRGLTLAPARGELVLPVLRAEGAFIRPVDVFGPPADGDDRGRRQPEQHHQPSEAPLLH